MIGQNLNYIINFFLIYWTFVESYTLKNDLWKILLKFMD